MLKQVATVGIGLQTIGLGRFGQTEKCGADFGSVRSSGKFPAFAAQDERADGIFGNAVVRLQEPGIDVNNQSKSSKQGNMALLLMGVQELTKKFPCFVFLIDGQSLSRPSATSIFLFIGPG